MQARFLLVTSLLCGICALGQLAQLVQLDSFLVKQESLSYQAGQVTGKLLKLVAFAGAAYYCWLRAKQLQKASVE